jgi:prevent-host-death family protein
MTVKLSLRELQRQLPELLDRAAESTDPVVVQRRGKDDVVIVSARQWRRLATGQRLDALGPSFRLSPAKQKRVEELLATKRHARLTKAQRQELDALLRECDEILLQRADAMDRMQ